MEINDRGISGPSNTANSRTPHPWHGAARRLARSRHAVYVLFLVFSPSPSLFVQHDQRGKSAPSMRFSVLFPRTMCTILCGEKWCVRWAGWAGGVPGRNRPWWRAHGRSSASAAAKKKRKKRARKKSDLSPDSAAIPPFGRPLIHHRTTTTLPRFCRCPYVTRICRLSTRCTLSLPSYKGHDSAAILSF